MSCMYKYILIKIYNVYKYKNIMFIHVGVVAVYLINMIQQITLSN